MGVSRDTSIINENNNVRSSCDSEKGQQFINTTSESLRSAISSETDAIFDKLRIELKLYNINNDEINHYLDLLQQSIGEMLLISKCYEYKGLPATGYVTFVIMVKSFLRHFVNRQYLQKSPQSINSLREMLHGFIFIRNLLRRIHQIQFNKSHTTSTTTISNNNRNDDDANNHDDDDDDDPIESGDGENDYKKQDANHEINCSNNTGLFVSGINETVHQLNNFKNAISFQQVLNRDYSSYWLTGSRTKLFINLYRIGCSISYKGMLRAPKLLNKNERAKVFVKFASDANMRIPFDSCGVIDAHFARKIFARHFASKQPVKCKNFWCPSQGRWIVPDCGAGIIENWPPIQENKQIRCRLYKHRKKCDDSSGLIVFHCHGSGFIVSRPETHDIYLKPWTAHFNGVPIVSVDYTLKAKFPRQFQDSLDAYLWLISGHPQVEQTIGFQPKKVIVVGDSAGGMIVMSTIFLLNEIRKKSSDYKIIMPEAVITFYGAFWLNAEWSPSKLMSMFDPILHYGNILAIAGCFSGIQGNKKTFKNPPKTSLGKLGRYTCEDLKYLKRISFPRKMKTWYIKDGHINYEKILKVHQTLQGPYVTCPLYDALDELKDVSLYLITTFGCIFLDDNIEMAKSWKGPVELHCLEGQEHGFLFMPFEKEAFAFSLRKMEQIVLKCQTTSLNNQF